jgi:hypothetical protein
MSEVFVENCSHSAAGMLVDSPAWPVLCMAGQSDGPAPFFYSLGSAVFKKHGDKIVAEGAMELMATIARLVVEGAHSSVKFVREHQPNLQAWDNASDETWADLCCFFSDRIKHHIAPENFAQFRSYAELGNQEAFAELLIRTVAASIPAGDA